MDCGERDPMGITYRTDIKVFPSITLDDIKTASDEIRDVVFTCQGYADSLKGKEGRPRVRGPSYVRNKNRSWDTPETDSKTTRPVRSAAEGVVQPGSS